VIQYRHGEPKVVFTDSTHAEIWLATTRRGLEITREYGRGKKDVKVFAVSETELAPPHFLNKRNEERNVGLKPAAAR
jgi:hypothetical protein